MRKLVFGLLGFAALGVGALSVQPAAAQPYYPGYGYRGPAVEYRYGRPAPAVRVQYGRPYYGRPYYGRPYGGYRPVRPVRRLLGRVPAGLERLPLGAPSDRGLPHGRQTRLPLLS